MEISRRVQELEAENLAMKAILKWIKRDVGKVNISTEMSDIFRTLAGISWLCSDRGKSIAIEMAYKNMEKDSRESEKSREQMKEQETE